MMSNLSVNNRSDDKKSSGSFPNLFGQHVFDDFVQNFTSHLPFAREAIGSGESKLDFVNPKVDITESKKTYTLTAELPGLDNDDITLDLSDGILTLSGQKKYENEADTDDNVHVMERNYGSFQRSFRLPVSVEQDAIEAEFKKGLLKVKLPKSVKAQELQRKIKISN
tara:strand:+ start:655 stop:1155 length:501 start_codon:yes stop_codon:yes gene_type:complete